MSEDPVERYRVEANPDQMILELNRSEASALGFVIGRLALTKIKRNVGILPTFDRYSNILGKLKTFQEGGGDVICLEIADDLITEVELNLRRYIHSNPERWGELVPILDKINATFAKSG